MTETTKKIQGLLVKNWFYSKANAKLNYCNIDGYPLYDTDNPSQTEDNYYEIDDAYYVGETEKAVLFRVATETYSGNCGKPVEMWFPKSVVKYSKEF